MPISDHECSALAALVLGTLCAAAAAQGTHAPSPSWLDEIATIDAQTQLLKKRDELRRELEKSTAGSIAALPSVVSIMVLDSVPQAQLYYSSGRLSHAKVGTLIAPSVRIASISENGVEVEVTQGRAKHQLPLEFATFESRFPGAANANARGASSARDDAVQFPLLPEPPRVNMGSPLPPGMLAESTDVRARGGDVRETQER